MQKKKLRLIDAEVSSEKDSLPPECASGQCNHEAHVQASSMLTAMYKLSKEYTEVRTSYERLLKQTSNAIMKCLELRDPYTYGHSLRVMEYSLLIGRGSELDAIELKNLELAAMFHDIGKIGVRDCVLNKETRLSDQEHKSISKHPQYGFEVLQLIDEFKNISEGVLHHHERLDGKGYPHNVSGNEIPLYSRIILVADTFDAMTSTRPYRKMLPIETAYEELIRFSGSQFDPQFVEVFLKEHQKLSGRTAEEAVYTLVNRKKAA